MTLDELLNDPPKVHVWEPGKPTSSGLPRDFFAFIAEQLGPASRTLETGAGISTVVFALKRAQHTCVAPDGAEIDRLKAYCDLHAISMDCIDFQVTYSH